MEFYVHFCQPVVIQRLSYQYQRHVGDGHGGSQVGLGQPAGDQYHNQASHPDQCAVGAIITLIPIMPAGRTLLFPHNPQGFLLPTWRRRPTLSVTASNSAGISTSQSVVTYSTNHAYCRAAAHLCGLRQSRARGQSPRACIKASGKSSLSRADYDSLLGQSFQPITNNYTMIYITNSQLRASDFQRVVTAPDILFSAKDMASPPPPFGFYTADRRAVSFNVNNILTGLAGPGTIDPSYDHHL